MDQPNGNVDSLKQDSDETHGEEQIDELPEPQEIDQHSMPQEIDQETNEQQYSEENCFPSAVDPQLLIGLHLNYENNAPEAKGTIFPKVDFNAEVAAERLKKSMRGIGTDEKMVIKTLVQHDSLQREEIEQKYKSMYGQDLQEDLKTELGGHFESIVLAMMMSKYELLTSALNHSFTFVGSDANVLTEILCCRDENSIENLKVWYEKLYNQSLQKAMETYLKGDFKSLMISLVAGDRPPDRAIDQEKAKEDAQKLYDAGLGTRIGTEESEFINILNNRSFVQLNRTFDEYEKLSDEAIDASIKSEFSGDVRDGLLAIVKRVRDPYGFFAERLNESLRGAGTDDKTLIRIIVSRSEDDLENIKERYMEMYGNSLAHDVKEDTGGDYSKLLLAIINNNSNN